MQKKLVVLSKVGTTISRTFECTTNSRTAEVQALCVQKALISKKYIFLVKKTLMGQIIYKSELEN